MFLVFKVRTTYIVGYLNEQSNEITFSFHFLLSSTVWHLMNNWLHIFLDITSNIFAQISHQTYFHIDTFFYFGEGIFIPTTTTQLFVTTGGVFGGRFQNFCLVYSS